jgi:hypothetical protein
MEKVAQKLCATFAIFKKYHEVNNHPMGEEAPI